MATPDKTTVGSRLILPCQCGCAHVAVTCIEEWKEDPASYYVEFYVGWRSPRWRERIKGAFKVLRANNDMWFHSIVWEESDLKDLNSYLTELLQKADKTN